MADFIKKLYSYFLASSGVTTDSRNVPPNSLFFALKGDHFDGNEYAEQAIEKGARYVVIDDPKAKLNKQYILVDNALVTLQLLAQYHRKQFDIPVLAITGSNGKTTTKELVRDVLAQKYFVHATKGNLNNHIGVPLTLLTMPRDAEFAVIEMGASHEKEIQLLCDIARPTYGLVTNIGQAHLEGFGGIDGVKRGKGELYDFLAKNEGVGFYNADEPYLDKLAQKVPIHVSYGTKSTEVSHILVEAVSDTEKVVAKVPQSGWGYRVFAQISGDHNFENVKTAIAIGKYFKVPFLRVKQAIEAYVPANMRSQTFELDSNIVFLDAYNANPTSMKMALKSFVNMKLKDEQVAVLGDMLELGAFSEEYHREILDMVSQMSFSQVWLVGDLFCKVDADGRYLHFNKIDEVANWLAQNPKTNTAFFVKGSRGIRLEQAFVKA